MHFRTTDRPLALVLVGVLVLVAGCGSSQPAEPTAETDAAKGLTPASQTFDINDGMPDIAAHAAPLAEVPTHAPADTYDPDGDGFTDARMMVQSVEDSWQAFVFPPGYQFAIDRFRSNYEDRVERNDERWEIRYNFLIVSNAQTCAWLSYWLDIHLADDQEGLDEANRMLSTVIPQNFIYYAMTDYVQDLGNAALLGDVATIQEGMTVLRCTNAYYQPDWSGPITEPTTAANRVQPPYRNGVTHDTIPPAATFP